LHGGRVEAKHQAAYRDGCAFAHSDFDDRFLGFRDQFDAVALKGAEHGPGIAFAGHERHGNGRDGRLQSLVHPFTPRLDSGCSPGELLFADNSGTMISRFLPALLACLAFAIPATAADGDPPMISIAIHGGAGVISRASMSADNERAYRADLERALDAGYAVLEKGGSSLDATVAAVRILEDSPYFNAGHGAVFSHAGINELDAAIMDGATQKAGAVAGVQHIRNPIELARMVMERTSHVLLSGDGAEEFALEQGVTLVPGSYFYTERRWKQLEEAQKAEKTERVASADEDIGFFSTVGAVARDKNGNLAAATSTGGMTNKRWGRIGDSPIIGAGTYADNATCAVSATGSGEYFIRAVVAHEICARVRLSGVTAAQAARDVIQGKLKEIGGDGGVIVVDKDGVLSLEFNTEGMFRAARDSRGRREVAIY
jgi:beta-aspartyl-peptidase (threonine type)